MDPEPSLPAKNLFPKPPLTVQDLFSKPSPSIGDQRQTSSNVMRKAEATEVSGLTISAALSDRTDCRHLQPYAVGGKK